MGVRDLTIAVDKYLNTHVGDKLRAYDAIGTSGSQKSSNTSGVSLSCLQKYCSSLFGVKF